MRAVALCMLLGCAAAEEARGAGALGLAARRDWHETLWPIGRGIAFTVGAGLDAHDVRIARALREWRRKTCLHFVRCGGGGASACRAPYMEFVAGSGAAPLGRQAGATRIPIAEWYEAGEMLIAIGRALGLGYEHTRADREHFVHVAAEEVGYGRDADFAVAAEGASLGPYDYTSVMHYQAFAYSVSNRATIVAPTAIGLRSALSAKDVAAVNFMYHGCRRRFARPTCMTSVAGTGPGVVLRPGESFPVDFTALYVDGSAMTVHYTSTAPANRAQWSVANGGSVGDQGSARAVFTAGNADAGQTYVLTAEFRADDGTSVECRADVSVEAVAAQANVALETRGHHGDEVVATSGTITDGYAEYPAQTIDSLEIVGRDCVVTFTHIGVEETAGCAWDYVEIIAHGGGGGGKFCGATPPAPLQLSGSGFTVVMFSDNIFHGTGFDLAFTCGDLTPAPPIATIPPTPAPATLAPQTLSPPTPAPPSPAPPTPAPPPPCVELTTREHNGQRIEAACGWVEDGYELYPDHANEQLTIVGSNCRIHMLFLDIEWQTFCNYDSVMVMSRPQDGAVQMKSCGLPSQPLPSPVQLAGDEFTLFFNSDSSRRYSGFRLYFSCDGGAPLPTLTPPTASPPTPVPPTASPPTPIPPTPAPVTPAPACIELSTQLYNGFTAVGQCGTVEDGYDPKYPIGARDEMTVQGTDCLLEFLMMDIEPHPYCLYDSLDVFDGSGTLVKKVCGLASAPLPAPIQLRGSSFKLIMSSDSSREYSGFKLKFQCQ